MYEIRPLSELKFIEDNKDKKFFVFVFGNMKKNYPLNHVMIDSRSKLIGQFVTEDEYVMYDMGEYPIISNLGNNKYPVIGEVYEIDATTLIDVNNKLNAFDKKYIKVKGIESEVLTFTTFIKLNTLEVLPDINGLLEWRFKI